MTKLMTVDEMLDDATENLQEDCDELDRPHDPIDRDEIRVSLDLLEIAISELTIAALTEEQVFCLKEWVDSETDDMTEIPESLSGVLEWNESMTCLILKKQDEILAAASPELPAATATTDETSQSNLKKRLEVIYEASAKANKLRGVPCDRSRLFDRQRSRIGRRF